MPGGDGTGPPGGGAGRKVGRGQSSGIGGKRPGVGPGGYCVCPRCGVRMAHEIGISCSSLKCPGCGTEMTRG
jgi:hypothetical protein